MRGPRGLGLRRTRGRTTRVSGDCVIVGGGLAGLACANRLTELGGRPIVVEQGEAPDYPCNTRFSGGIVHVAFKDPRAPPNEVRAAVERLVIDEPATALAGELVDHGHRALTWLQGEGTKFVKGGALEFMRWVLAPPRPRRPGLDWKGRGPDVLLRNLTARLIDRGGVLERGVHAKGLAQRDGRLNGVMVDRGARVETIEAPVVVIADGGFQGNSDLVSKYITRSPGAVFQRGAGTGRGDGLQMAAALGADLVGMDRFYGHLLGRGVFGNDKLWPYPTVDAIAQSSFMVDGQARRFVDEGLGGVHMANQLVKLADPLSAAVIFDDAVWHGVAADNRYPPCMNPGFVNEGGEVLVANSVSDLAIQLGVPGKVLAATAQAYSRAVEEPVADALSPPRTGTPIAPQPFAAPPFRAIRVCAGMTYTMGGIRIDGHCRAQTKEGEVIEGLYAVGSASGGMEGGIRAAYLGGLIKAVVTGLQAAESIAGGSA